MTSAQTVTIAIPYYRGLSYLHQAIRSVLDQTLLPHEIIISDDSPEGEAAECVAFWPGRIRYLHNPRRLGIVGNWNRCLDETKTEFVVLLNADDRLLPEYTMQMLDAAARYPDATGIFCSTVTVNADNKQIFSFIDWVKGFLWPYGYKLEQRVEHEIGLASLLRGNWIMCPSMFYRLSRLRQERFDKRWNQVLDLDLFCRLLLKGHVFVGLRQRLFAFRRHADNHTKDMEKDYSRFREEVACSTELADKAEILGWDKAARIGRRHAIVRLHFLYTFIHKAMRGDFQAALRMLRSYPRIFCTRSSI